MPYSTIETFTHNGFRIRLALYRGVYYCDAENLNIPGRRVFRRWSLGTKDIGAAREAYYHYLAELKRVGRLDRVFATDIGGWIDTFLSWSKVNSKSPRTYESHAASMKYVRAFVEDNRVQKLTPQVYEQFKKELLNQGKKPRTVDIRLTAIGAMIRVLEDLDVVARGVIPRPRLIREPRTTAPQFWTDRDLSLILRACEGRYLHDMILFGVNTGLRRTELIHIRWDDVDLDNGFLVVQGYDIEFRGRRWRFEPKDHEVRRVKLNTVARDLLVRVRQSWSPWVFPTGTGTPRENYSTFNRDLRKACARAGVEKGASHSIRRTFAVHLLMGGADLESIRRLLGHSEISTTQVYLAVTDQHLDKVVDSLNLGAPKAGEKVVPFKQKRPAE